jgi:hypothetical protein
MYREYIMNKPELLKLIPIELKDKALGCWYKPEACHGDILAEIADRNDFRFDCTKFQVVRQRMKFSPNCLLTPY